MIADFGRRAESMGLDSIWMGEHVALFDKNTFGYPGSKDGRIPDVTATFGFLATRRGIERADGSPTCPSQHRVFRRLLEFGGQTSLAVFPHTFDDLAQAHDHKRHN
jgi:hypothetical protein